MTEQNQEIPNYTIQDVRVTPNEVDAIITDMRIVLAKSVYGETTRKPDQELIMLRIENDEFKIVTEQPIPKYDAGNVPDASKLGIFLKKYGKFQSGMQIKLEKDLNGFWKIRL